MNSFTNINPAIHFDIMKYEALVLILIGIFTVYRDIIQMIQIVRTSIIYSLRIMRFFQSIENFL